LAAQQPDPFELQKLQAVERHLGRCAELRKIGDWKSALREADAAIVAGADSCPLVKLLTLLFSFLWLLDGTLECRGFKRGAICSSLHRELKHFCGSTGSMKLT